MLLRFCHLQNHKALPGFLVREVILVYFIVLNTTKSDRPRYNGLVWLTFWSLTRPVTDSDSNYKLSSYNCELRSLGPILIMFYFVISASVCWRAPLTQKSSPNPLWCTTINRFCVKTNSTCRSSTTKISKGSNQMDVFFFLRPPTQTLFILR